MFYRMISYVQDCVCYSLNHLTKNKTQIYIHLFNTKINMIMKIYIKCLDTYTSIEILISIGWRFIEQGMIILNVNKKVKGEERRKGWNMKFVSVFYVDWHTRFLNYCRRHKMQKKTHSNVKHDCFYLYGFALVTFLNSHCCRFRHRMATP